jgi:membrane associated rhomboid family serine protease
MVKKFSWINFLDKIKIPLLFVLFIWGVEIYEEVAGVYLGRYGIYPREMGGLKGILFSPLLHNDWNHIFSNSAPLLVLGSVMMVFYNRVAVVSFVIIYLLSGFSVWLFARPAYHIGASGVVYGLISWMLWTGLLRRNVKSIVLALCTVVMYAGYEQGLLPNEKGVSWESHLSGAIIGILTAFLFKNTIEIDEIKSDPWANEDTTKVLYLQSDIFDKTKAQRIQEAIKAEKQRQHDLAEIQRLRNLMGGDMGQA